MTKDIKKICEETFDEHPELFRRLAEYEKMSNSQKEGLLSPKAINGLGE
jgi:hypothetical protein